LRDGTCEIERELGRGWSNARAAAVEDGAEEDAEKAWRAGMLGGGPISVVIKSGAVLVS